MSELHSPTAYEPLWARFGISRREAVRWLAGIIIVTICAIYIHVENEQTRIAVRAVAAISIAAREAADESKTSADEARDVSEEARSAAVEAESTASEVKDEIAYHRY